MSQTAEDFQRLKKYLHAQVLGQPAFIEHLLITILADGHLLVEGPPGLAKTRAVQLLAACIESPFHRIQFTPDLLPADLTGTDIYRPETGTFEFQSGPLFHSMILADEINRAPAKVQSALLEAMAERQITVGKKTYPLPKFFCVLATQNPLEQEGTYPLPEAQLDRFLMHVQVDYPDAKVEQQILQLNREEARQNTALSTPSLHPETLFKARQGMKDIYMDESVELYLVALIIATRQPEQYDPELARWIQVGASPRATIALDRCARARAWLQQRNYVTPEDIMALLPSVLRHRIILSYEAKASGVNSNQVIQRILDLVPVL